MSIPLGAYIKGEIYRSRLTLYLDILGFTSAVEGAKSNLDESKRLINLLEGLVSQNTGAAEADESGWLVHLGYRGVRRMSMSDSILVSIDTEFHLTDLRKQGIFSKGFQFNELEDMQYLRPYANHLPLSSILRDCARIQVGLIEEGFLSRGSLTVGSLRQHKGVVIGPAYNEAVCLEKKSFLPAITISKGVIGKYVHSWGELLSQREQIKTILRKTPNTLNISAQAIWAVAPESEKWVNEIQSCADCVNPINEQYIFNFLKFANTQNLWLDKKKLIAQVDEQRSKWQPSIWNRLTGSGRKKIRIHDRWSWVYQELVV